VNNLETFKKNDTFVPPNFDENNKKLLDLIPILIKKRKQPVFEGAAIRAAIEMETRSIEVSTPQAKEATAQNIKSYSNV
jgi:rubrerythrin